MKWNQLIAMLTLLLVGVLLAQVLGAPNLCDGPCDSGNGYQSRSSYSRYSKSSTGQNYAGRPTVSSGLGVTGGRLEDLDTENVVNSFGNSKGVSYEDKKHFVTDDRRGEAHYKEGQEVFDNGYKKWSESKWEWDSQGNYQPRADSHILSAAEFNGKIRELNQRIATFMGSYHGSQTITAQTLDDFNANANLITGQLNDVCNQVGQDTALYQQAQNLLQSFQRQQAQKQQELTASYQATFHHESSSSSKFRVGSSSPITPSASIYRPAPIVAVTQRPVVDQQFIIQQQQTVEKYNECQNLIQNFFNEFRVPNTDQQYREDLNNQINLINQNLVELSHSSLQNDSTRIAIQTMKDQFERYVSDLQAKIRQIEQKQREEAEEIRRRIQQYETQKRQNDEELQRLQDAENQEKRRQQELRQQIDRAQQISLQDQIKIEEERRRLETQNQQLQQLQQPLTAPRLATLSISSTYESSVQASGSAGSSTQNTLTPVVNQPIIQPTVQHRPAPAPIQILQPHVDVTALVSKYNREVHRLQNELVNFQMQVARLTEENSATLLPTVNNQVENFRREIDDLCGNSQRYQLDDVHQRALDVKSRFDSVLQNFQNVKSSFTASSGYSSGSSWSSSGRYSHQVPAKIVGGDSTNSQVLEVEHVKRPASSHSGYSASAGYSSSSEYNSSGSFRSGGADDCPERAAGQPCASSLRYKRHAGDSGAYYDNSDRPLDFQQHQSVFGGSPYQRQPNVGPLMPQLQQYMQQNPGPQIGILHLDPYRGILKPPGAGLRDYSQRTRPVESQRLSSGPIRSQSQTMSQGHRPEDLTRQSDEMEDYYGTRSQINRPIFGEGLELRQMPEDLSQQHQTFENDREFESYQKPRSESVGVSYRPRDKVQPARITNLGNESNSRGIRRQIEFSTENPESVNDPSRIKPMTSEGEEPIMLERIQQGNRSKSDKESDGQTLQNSGFYDGFQRNAKAEEIEEPETGFSIVSAADLLGENPDVLQSTKQSEQTLQNSGFYQKPRQNEFTINSDFNNKNENVSAAASDNHYDAQGLVPENLTKFEVLGNHDSTQRTAGQRNLNSGSQENGQYSSLSNSKPDKTGYGNDSDNPIIKLAVRPIPRYTAPWQVSHEVSQDSRIGKDQIVDLNSSIGQTSAPQNPSQSDSNDHSGPLRGDLPGISHPKDDVDTPTSLPPVSIATAQTPLPPAVKIITTTTSLPYVIQIPTTARPMKIIDCNICGQRHEQIVDQSNSFHNSRWVHNISQQNQFNQGQYAEQYHYNETSRTHHNYHVTHCTNYFNQQNSRLELRQQVPFGRQNSQIQFSQTLQPVGINVEQSSSNQYRQHYTNNFETQRLKPQEFQQRNQFGLDQQVQEPVFDQQSGQNKYGQQHEDSLIDNQRTESNFQKVIPLHEKSLPTESATSHQFWKRVGHKLSYSFDKAREGARTIFG